MPKLRGLLTFLLAVGAALPFAARAADHPDTYMDYLGCDGSRWRATWTGDQFDQKRMDGGTGDRVGPTLRYRTGDGTCWDGTWDERIRKFHHQPISGGGQAHDDYIISYITFNGSKWDALRADRTHFYHIGPK